MATVKNPDISTALGVVAATVVGGGGLFSGTGREWGSGKGGAAGHDRECGRDEGGHWRPVEAGAVRREIEVLDGGVIGQLTERGCLHGTTASEGWAVGPRAGRLDRER